MTGDEWAERRRAEREREIAAGSGRHWTPEQARPAVKSSSKQLRRVEAKRQRLQVLCRSRCIAVVLEGASPGAMEVAIEPKSTGGLPGDGYGLHILDLLAVGNGPVIVGCRNCAPHGLDPHKLRAEAWEGQPGRPRVVGVSDVVNSLT